MLVHLPAGEAACYEQISVDVEVGERPRVGVQDVLRLQAVRVTQGHLNNTGKVHEQNTPITHTRHPS